MGGTTAARKPRPEADTEIDIRSLSVTAAANLLKVQAKIVRAHIRHGLRKRREFWRRLAKSAGLQSRRESSSQFVAVGK